MKHLCLCILSLCITLMTATQTEAQTDLNNDGVVNAHDLSIFASTWHNTIPEPTPFEEITVPLDLPDNAVELEMILILAGTFTMGGGGSVYKRGSAESDSGRDYLAGKNYDTHYPCIPEHKITISKPFAYSV